MNEIPVIVAQEVLKAQQQGAAGLAHGTVGMTGFLALIVWPSVQVWRWADHNGHDVERLQFYAHEWSTLRETVAKAFASLEVPM